MEKIVITLGLIISGLALAQTSPNIFKITHSDESIYLDISGEAAANLYNSMMSSAEDYQAAIQKEVSVSRGSHLDCNFIKATGNYQCRIIFNDKNRP